MKRNNNIVIGIILLWFLWFVLVATSITTTTVATTTTNTIHKLELVIARYNETLDWLQEEPFHRHPAIIYNKGNNENFVKADNIRAIIPMKNVGRETHSYLYHIVKNYDNLADITVFLPGSCEMESKKTRAIQTVLIAETTGDSVFYDKSADVYEEHKKFQLEKWQSSFGGNKKINSENILTPALDRPFGVWFKKRFGNIKVTEIAYYGIFAIRKECILRHPKSYYESFMYELEVSSNPEVGHYFERSWGAVFHPIRRVGSENVLQ